MCLSPNKLVHVTVFGVKFKIYPSLSLNIVDVISMINKFLSNGKLWSIDLCYFLVKKNEPKFSLVNFRLKNRRESRNYFLISFLFHA